MSGIKAKLNIWLTVLCYLKKVIMSNALFQKNSIENLNYWNVELQEAYFSPAGSKDLKFKIINFIFPYYVSKSIDWDLLKLVFR